MDHGIKKCPDGSYLHAASGMPPEAVGETGPPTDYLHLWRYDEDFNILAYSEFRDGIGTHAHNDPTVICAPNAKGVFFLFKGISLQQTFLVWIQFEVKEVIALEDYPRGNGGGVIYDVHADEYIHLGMAHDKPLTMNRYDSDWRLIETVDRDLVEAPLGHIGHKVLYRSEIILSLLTWVETKLGWDLIKEMYSWGYLISVGSL